MFYFTRETRAIAGDYAVYREAAGLESITTAVTTLDFDTTVSEGAGFSIDGGNQNVTLTDQGHYLAMYNLPMESTSGTNRSEMQGQLTLGGWVLPYGHSTCYIRRAQGLDECWMAGAAIIESTSTSQAVNVQTYRTDSASDGVQRRAGESGFMLVRLDDTWDYVRVREVGGGQTFNTTAWTTVTWDTNDELDAGFSRAGGDITLVESGRYLVTYNVMFHNSSGSARRNSATRLTLDGYELPGTRATAYLRGSKSTQDHAASFVGVVVATTTNQVLRLEGVCSSEVCGNVTNVGDQTGITITKLPSSAEFVALGYSADDQLLDVTNQPFTWDTQYEVDAASFSHSTTTDPSHVTVAQDGDYVFFASFFSDRSATTSGNRIMPRWKWWLNNSELGYGSFSRINRGDQQTTGAWTAGNAGGIVLPGLTAGNYVEIVASDEGTANDPFAHYVGGAVGIQGIRLASLVTPDLEVGTTGTQTATSSIPHTNLYLGGAFSMKSPKGPETVTDITITENGTIDASSGLDNVRLYYEYDTSAPYNCASESYAGTETQFGATSTFPGANGSTTFSGSVAVGTTSTMCVYVVADVVDAATDAETIDIEISDPSTEVVLVDGIVYPEGTVVALAGSTTLVDEELTQSHYHWRLDDNLEPLASSATGGLEDTVLSPVSVGQQRRLRVEVSNEGSATSTAVQYRLEFAKLVTSCDVASGWVDVNAVNDAWNLYDSANLTNGNDTTNVLLGSRGAVTDENVTFLTPNGGVRDTTSQTGLLTLGPNNFAELEYALMPTASSTEGATYCFRVTDAGTPIAHYNSYAEATIAADVRVSATGTQITYTDAGATDVYVGGVFAIADQVATRTVTSITLTENGTIDAQANLHNARLYYEHDTSSPYTCDDVSYNGTESQYGATATSFSSANGTSTFAGTVGISTTSALCVYPVLDVGYGAGNGETIDLEIATPGLGDVTVSTGTVNPNTAVALEGSTTIRKAAFDQTHYHWRNDDGTEAGASSATGGSEDTPVTAVLKTETQRVRMEVSNVGATTSTSTVFGLEYAERVTTCNAVASWTSIDSSGGAWAISDTANLTNGNTTTNIAVATGGVSDSNTTFLTPNAGVRDRQGTTSPLAVSGTSFVELEYAVEATMNATFGSTYCFRLTADGSPLAHYTAYPQATIRTNQDFYVQRGEATIANGTSTFTIVAGTDYVAPSASTSAFIRITNTQYTGAGAGAGGGTQNADTVTTYIKNPSNILDSITFVRSGTTNTTYVAWEILEYTGPSGGDNEMKVRAAQNYTMGTSETTSNIAVSGVTDDAQVVVFITAQGNPDTGTSNYNTSLATANWNGGSNEVVLERSDNGTTPTISYAVVEFTGQNWLIQRVQHQYSSVGTWEYEGIIPVNDISRAFLHVQKRTAENTLASYGHEVYLSGAGTVAFQLDSQALNAGNHVSVAWVIENTQTNGTLMAVTRSNGTQAGGAEPAIALVSIGTTVADLSNTSLFMNNRTTGTGHAYPRAMIGAYLYSNTQYQIFVSDTGQTRNYRTEVVEWPTAVLTLRQNYYRFYDDNGALDPTDPWPPGAPDLGENTSITGLDAPPTVGDHVRIRMSVNASGANLSQEIMQFKLEYGLRDTSCSSITEWHDLGDTGSTTAIWRGYNATPLDGTALSTNPPTGGDLNLSVADRAGTYEEQNPTALNPYRILIGDDAEYDWNVEAHATTDFSSYCFRMTQADGTAFDEYLYYPTITMAGFSIEQQGWRWYDDETSSTPSAALAASNTAPTNIAQGNAVKLRVSVAELSGRSGPNTKFKLQWSEFSDFSTVADVDDMDTCALGSRWCYFNGAGTEGATITDKVLELVDPCSGGTGDGCGTHNEYSYTPEVVGEVGTTSVDSAGTLVTLKHTYTAPVFIVESLTGDSGGGASNRPAAAMVTATTTSSFTVRVQEPDNEADTHGAETIGYIVMERGAYQLPDGRRVDVDTKDTSNYYGNAVAGASDDTCSFTQTFSSVPLLMTALQSNNNTATPDFLTTSQALLTANDFACSMEVPDSETNAPGSAETYGWIAIEPGTFTNNGIVMEATTTSQSVTGWTDTPWYEQLFTYGLFSGIPGLVGTKQTRNGAEGGWVRYDKLTGQAAQFAIDERDDGERAHTTESVGYLAFATSSGVLYREGTSDFTFTKSTRKEFEFTVQHKDARPNVTYFFRLYDVNSGQAVAANATTSYPSLSTEGAALTFSISGITSGAATEGVTTDVTTTATSVPFGTLAVDAEKNAAQRLTVTTNGTEGYQILAYERQDLSAAGATIGDVTGTNAVPQTWTSGCTVGATSCYGYHVGDNTLAGGSMRFLVDDTYAALTSTPEEVAYSSGPVSSESTDMVYRIKVGTLQPAGHYQSKMVYIVVPVF